MTEDVIPEAPEVPIDAADVEQVVEKVLVPTYIILFNSIENLLYVIIIVFVIFV